MFGAFVSLGLRYVITLAARVELTQKAKAVLTLQWTCEMKDFAASKFVGLVMEKPLFPYCTSHVRIYCVKFALSYVH